MRLGLAIFVLSIAAFAGSIGTPHILGRSECKIGVPCQAYWECDYVGIQGWRRFFPSIEPDQEQQCRSVMFFPVDQPLLIWHDGEHAPKYRGLP